MDARAWSALALGALLSLSACAPGGDALSAQASAPALQAEEPTCCATEASELLAPPAALGWSVASSERGSFTARWRSDPDPLPVNEPFQLDLVLERGDTTGAESGDALEAVEVYVHAWMPDHRHGMLRQPVATPLGEGRYRVRGALLHMGGYWQLHVDVVSDGQLERASFDLDVR